MAMTPIASRSRRRACEPTTPIRIVSRPPTSSVASARPWRASGSRDGDGPDAVAEPHALLERVRAARRSASPWTSAIRVPDGRWAPTASRTPGTENVARKAPDGAGGGRAHRHRHGDAAAASRRRRAARRWSACRRCGSRPAARRGRRLLDGVARRVALAARARVDDREARGVGAGVVGAGAHRGAVARRCARARPRSAPSGRAGVGERVELRAPHRQRALHGRGDVGQPVERPDRRVARCRSRRSRAGARGAGRARGRRGRPRRRWRGRWPARRWPSTSVWRGALGAVAGPGPERVGARAERDQPDAGDEQPQRERRG